jgi:hypothetical protein
LPIDIDKAELALMSPVDVMVAARVPKTLEDSEFTIELLSDFVAVATELRSV